MDSPLSPTNAGASTTSSRDKVAENNAGTPSSASSGPSPGSSSTSSSTSSSSSVAGTSSPPVSRKSSSESSSLSNPSKAAVAESSSSKKSTQRPLAVSTAITSWNAGDAVLARFPPDPEDETFYNARVISHPRGSNTYLIIYTDPEFQGDPPIEVSAGDVKEAPASSGFYSSAPSSAALVSNGVTSRPQKSTLPSASWQSGDLDSDSLMLEAQALSSLDNLGIPGWDGEDGHREGFRNPTKWQARAEAIRAITSFCQSRFQQSTKKEGDVESMHLVAHALFAKTHFESKHVGVVGAILELAAELVQHRGFPVALLNQLVQAAASQIGARQTKLLQCTSSVLKLVTAQTSLRFVLSRILETQLGVHVHGHHHITYKSSRTRTIAPNILCGVLDMCTELVQANGTHSTSSPKSSNSHATSSSPSSTTTDITPLLLSLAASPFGLQFTGARGVTVAATNLVAELYSTAVSTSGGDSDGTANEVAGAVLKGLLTVQPSPLPDRKFRSLLETLHSRGLALDIVADEAGKPSRNNLTDVRHQPAQHSENTSDSALTGSTDTGTGQGFSMEHAPAGTGGLVDLSVGEIRKHVLHIVRQLQTFNDKDSWKARASALSSLQDLMVGFVAKGQMIEPTDHVIKLLQSLASLLERDNNMQNRSRALANVKKLGLLVPPEAFKPHTEQYKHVLDEKEKLDKLQENAKKGKGANVEAESTNGRDEQESVLDAEAVEELTNIIAEANMHNRMLDSKAIVVRAVHLLLPAFVNALGDNKQVIRAAASQAMDAWVQVSLNPKFLEVALGSLGPALSKIRSLRESGLEWACRYVGIALSSKPRALSPIRARKLLLLPLVQCVQDKNLHVRKLAADLLCQIVASDAMDTTTALRSLLRRRMQRTAIKLMLPVLQDVYLRAAVPFNENDFLEEPPAIPASVVSHSASVSSKSCGNQREGHARSGSSELPAPRKLTNGEAKSVEKHFLKGLNDCRNLTSELHKATADQAKLRNQIGRMAKRAKDKGERQQSHEQRALIAQADQLDHVIVPALHARIEQAASSLRNVVHEHKSLLKPRFEYREATKLIKSTAALLRDAKSKKAEVLSTSEGSNDSVSASTTIQATVRGHQQRKRLAGSSASRRQNEGEPQGSEAVGGKASQLSNVHPVRSTMGVHSGVQSGTADQKTSSEKTTQEGAHSSINASSTESLDNESAETSTSVNQPKEQLQQVSLHGSDLASGNGSHENVDDKSLSAPPEFLRAVDPTLLEKIAASEVEAKVASEKAASAKAIQPVHGEEKKMPSEAVKLQPISSQ